MVGGEMTHTGCFSDLNTNAMAFKCPHTQIKYIFLKSVYYGNKNLHKREVTVNQDIITPTKPQHTFHGVEALDNSQQKRLQKQNLSM